MQSVCEGCKYRLREVSIEITHECGLKCIMCSSDAEYPNPIANSLTYAEIRNLIDDAKNLGATTISLSGGEPLQHPRISDIVDYCYYNDLKVLFYTTGLQFNGESYKIIEDDFIYRLRYINATMIFDLQSHDPRTHDRIMGVEGSHDMMMEAIDRARKIGVTLETHFVPQRENIRHIEDYVYWLNDMGFRQASFLRLVPQGRARDNETMLSKRQFRDLQELFYDLRYRRDLDIKIRLGHPINFQFLIDDNEPLDSCRGGTDAPLITPWGSVHTCPAWKQLEHYSAGNIRHQSLKSIWEKSRVYNVFRWFIHEKGYLNMDHDSKCHNCEFFHGCKGKCVAQRLIEYSDGRPIEEAILLGSDPMCWHEP